VLVDGAAAVDHVMATTALDAAALPFLGWSLGGSVAIHTARTRGPQVLMTESTFASADQIIDEGSGLDLPAGWLLEDPFDNVAAIADVAAPVLISHGLADDYIQSTHADALYEAANDPKSLRVVEGADHDLAEADEGAYREAIASWIAAWPPALEP
jgi:fermentation-respiration switch protein FrsA (DUF1100 family)